METTNNQAVDSEFGDFFGQAKQGGDGFGWKTFSLSEKDPNVYRIAPPVKSLKTTGRWSVYDSLHYGYTVPNQENPDKPRHRPFRCIYKKNRATGMLEQDCPECALLESKEKEIEAIKAQQMAQGRSADEAEEFVKGARRLLREHNLDKKHYVLAKNVAGEWGVLKLPHRAKQALDNLIERYMKDNEGRHPLDPSGGVWFEFTRKGKGLQTEHHVAIVQENLGGGRFQYKNAALSALDVQGIQKCPDLATLNDNKILTYDQILALVRSNGDQQIAAQIFNSGSRQQPGQRQTQPSTPAPQPVTAAAAVSATPAATTPTVDVAALQAQIAAMQAQMAAAQAQTASAPLSAAVSAPVTVTTPAPAATTSATPAPAASAAPATSFQDLMKLDPKEFLSRFPDPNKK